jgi:type IV secretory pathway VirB10-like protein
MRALILSAVALMLNIALNITLAKYGADAPDSLIIVLWLVPLLPLGWLFYTHEKVKQRRVWLRERFSLKPKSTLAAVFVVLIIVVGSLSMAISGAVRLVAKSKAANRASAAPSTSKTNAPTPAVQNPSAAELAKEVAKLMPPPSPKNIHHAQLQDGIGVSDNTKLQKPPTASAASLPPMQQDCGGGNCAQSTGQQGGVTAGQINIGTPPPPEVRLVSVYKNRPHTYVQEGSTRTVIQGFESQYKVQVVGQQVPEVKVYVRHPTFIHIDCDKMIPGTMQPGTGSGGSGTVSCSVFDVYNSVGTITIFTTTELPEPKHFLAYQCIGSPCTALMPVESE